MNLYRLLNILEKAVRNDKLNPYDPEGMLLQAVEMITEGNIDDNLQSSVMVLAANSSEEKRKEILAIWNHELTVDEIFVCITGFLQLKFKDCSTPLAFQELTKLLNLNEKKITEGINNRVNELFIESLALSN